MVQLLRLLLVVEGVVVITLEGDSVPAVALHNIPMGIKEVVLLLPVQLPRDDRPVRLVFRHHLRPIPDVAPFWLP